MERSAANSASLLATPGAAEAPVAAASLASSSSSPSPFAPVTVHGERSLPDGTAGKTPSARSLATRLVSPSLSPAHPGRNARGRRLPEWLEQMILAVFCPGNRRRGTRPVQTEMAFEAVKVARNDLTTADVEVVVRPAAKPPRPLSAGCRTRLLRLWWTEGANRVRKLGGLLF